MPELPDIIVYIEALERRVLGHALEGVQIRGPFLLRTAKPPIESIQGRKVIGLRRVGKRIALKFDNEVWLVFHLMIAGRMHWSEKRVIAGRKANIGRIGFRVRHAYVDRSRNEEACVTACSGW